MKNKLTLALISVLVIIGIVDDYYGRFKSEKHILRLYEK